MRTAIILATCLVGTAAAQAQTTIIERRDAPSTTVIERRSEPTIIERRSVETTGDVGCSTTTRRTTNDVANSTTTTRKTDC